MVWITQGLFALLCALGAASLIWLLFGWLTGTSVCRAPWIVLSGRGDGDGLEAAVYRAAWLRRAGLWRGNAVIWDVGLTPEGRELVLRLVLRWPWVTFCPGGLLEEWLSAD